MCGIAVSSSPKWSTLSLKKPQKNLLKYCVRSGAIWCHCRHLSKVNCFDRWTTKIDRKRRIINPSRSPHTRRQLAKREETSKNSRRFTNGEYGESILGFVTRPPNDSHIWPSSPCTQMRLPSIEVWFARNLWRYTLDEWRRLHFGRLG